MRWKRVALTVVLAALAAIPAAPPALSGGAKLSKPPASGAQYAGITGQGEPLRLRVAGRAVYFIAFRFDCEKDVTGATSVEGIRLRRGRAGYHFRIATYGITSYSDEAPDENARIIIRGTFSRTAKSVRGVLYARTPRCSSGTVRWRAVLQRAD